MARGNQWASICRPSAYQLWRSGCDLWPLPVLFIAHCLSFFPPLLPLFMSSQSSTQTTNGQHRCYFQSCITAQHWARLSSSLTGSCSCCLRQQSHKNEREKKERGRCRNEIKVIKSNIRENNLPLPPQHGHSLWHEQMKYEAVRGTKSTQEINVYFLRLFKTFNADQKKTNHELTRANPLHAKMTVVIFFF